MVVVVVVYSLSTPKALLGGCDAVTHSASIAGSEYILNGRILPPYAAAYLNWYLMIGMMPASPDSVSMLESNRM